MMARRMRWWYRFRYHADNLMCQVFGHYPSSDDPDGMDLHGNLIYYDYCGRCGESMRVR